MNGGTALGWIRRQVIAARSTRGLTLIELLIILAIIGGPHIDRTASIRELHGSGSDRTGRGNRGTFRDPWGNAYEYLDLTLGEGQPRKDHALHPLNTDFDLYSKGKDGDSVAPLTAAKSRDDIERANDGQFIGFASKYLSHMPWPGRGIREINRRRLR